MLIGYAMCIAINTTRPLARILADSIRDPRSAEKRAGRFGGSPRIVDSLNR
jgi:hypothetical protein